MAVYLLKTVTYGSDIAGADPEELAPLYQIQAAVAGPRAWFGLHPHASCIVTACPHLEQMLYGYTLAGAVQMRMEDRIGSIQTGKLADLIILDRNLFDVPKNELIRSCVQVSTTRY